MTAREVRPMLTTAVDHPATGTGILDPCNSPPVPPYRAAEAGRAQSSPIWPDPDGTNHTKFAAGSPVFHPPCDIAPACRYTGPMSDSPLPYRVLARKYRPQTFSELIGQEAMVQTLANPIRRERLAH